MHEDLFAQAELLAKVDAKKPKQVNLRRAISASSLEVVDEAPTLDAARALDAAADAFVVAHAVHEDDDALVDAESLTARELDVLRLLAEGLPNKAIAARGQFYGRASNNLEMAEGLRARTDQGAAAPNVRP